MSLECADGGLQVLLLDGELLVIVHAVFVLAVRDHLLDFQAHVLEEFVDVLVALQNEDAPAVGSRVLLHQQLKQLQVGERRVVHFPIYSANVDAKYGNLVTVQAVLQEP